MTDFIKDTKYERKKKAIEHTKNMDRLFSKEIKDSIDNTTIYLDDNIDFHIDENKVLTPKKYKLKSMSSVDAIFKYSNKFSKTAVLNFASYKYPGGGFMNGSMAQEESLCHQSFLYNVLKEFNDSFYKYNKNNTNHGLYESTALYTPNIVFTNGNNTRKCDVITCANVNKSAVDKYGYYNDDCINEIISNRIEFVIRIASMKKVDNLILGAWGCGVFGNDPYLISKLFALALEYPQSTGITHRFNKIIFAVPKEHSSGYHKFSNYTAFKEVLTDLRLL